MSILATDNFNRANGNLGSNWSPASAVTGSIQITSDAVTPNASVPGHDAQFWNALSFPNDQSSQITLGATVTGQGLGVAVRVANTGGGQYYYLGAFPGSNVYQVGIVTAQNFTLQANLSVVPHAHDVIKLTIQGTTLTSVVNGTVIDTRTVSNFSSGAAGLFAFSVTTTAISGGSWIGSSLTAPNPVSVSTATGVQGSTNATFTVSGTQFDLSGSTLSFSGTGITVNSYSVQNATTVTASITIASNAPVGAQNVIITNADGQTGTLSNAFTVTASIPVPAYYSVPDCRKYATFPNQSRNVEGTLIYDVQTSSNPAVPGTDSRVSKPVASGTYPQNSRKRGTFGPNE